jgi:hypothetical protein
VTQKEKELSVAREIVELALQNECRRRDHIGKPMAPDFSAAKCSECMVERIASSLQEHTRAKDERIAELEKALRAIAPCVDF